MRQIPPIHPIEDEAWKSCFIVPDHIREELVGTRKLCMDVMDDMTKEEEHLQKEEERLRSQRQKIASEKAALASRVQKLESALAPHKKLLPEVLARIFDFTRYGDDTLYLSTNSRMIKFDPIRTAHELEYRPQDVCSFWRQVVYQTPGIRDYIWRGVMIYFRGFLGRRSHQLDHKQLLDAILELADFAKSLIARGALSLEVDFEKWPEITDGDLSDDVVLKQMIGDSLPQLEELIISNKNVTQEFMEACIDLLPTFPQLRSVDLDFRFEEGQFLPLPQRTMHSLIKLEIRTSKSISIGCFHQLLSCLPSLESCYVTVSCDSHLPLASEGSTRTVVHKSLTSLYFDNRHEKPLPSDIIAPLYALSLPSLRELEFKTDQCPPGNCLKLLSEFIQRSDRRLEELSFDCYYNSRDDIILEWSDLMATCLSNVKKLKVPFVFTPEILQKIAGKEFLQSIIRLEGRVVEECQWCQAIDHMLESEREGYAYFKKSWSLRRLSE